MSPAAGVGDRRRKPRPTVRTRVAAFDLRMDAQLERWRRRPAIGRVFRFASHVGDFSLVWQVIGLAVGLGIDRDVRHTLWFAALIGIESLVVNQGVKRLFRRTRPTTTGDERFQVRRPRTSSFPSGHASAGFFAATLLTAWVGVLTAPVWFLIAAVVAGSRAFVRIHHPSDVLAGAVFGAALGALALGVGAGHLLGA